MAMRIQGAAAQVRIRLERPRQRREAAALRDRGIREQQPVWEVLQ